ncbi:MAG: membrane dipeptidase [Erysipelotrichaceae bacterium]|nr:membrane dipeptidase [Erysipelotrichaceae bacterium]
MKIFDMHTDIGTDCLEYKELGNPLKIRHLDKQKAGGVRGLFSACYYDGTQNWDQMKEMVLNMQEQIKMNSDEVHWVKSKEDLIETDKLLDLISVEGMCGIDTDFENRIQWLYDNGVRVAIPAWNESNAICEGWNQNPSRGLTEDGKKVIKKMNELNMIIDVSHLNEKSFWDIISISTKPIMASHSNNRNVCNHGRNLTEQQIKAIAAKGGLIGVVSAKTMTHLDQDKKTVDMLAYQAKTIADMVGIEHVACGFDFMDYLDGWNDNRNVEGMPSADKAQNFVAALLRQGFSEEEAEMICWKNTVNFLKNNL